MEVTDESKRVVLTSGYVFFASLHIGYGMFDRGKDEHWWHVAITTESGTILIDQDLEGDADSVVGWLMWAMREFEKEFKDDFDKYMTKRFKELDWAEIEETLASLER